MSEHKCLSIPQTSSQVPEHIIVHDHVIVDDHVIVHDYRFALVKLQRIARTKGPDSSFIFADYFGEAPKPVVAVFALSSEQVHLVVSHHHLSLTSTHNLAHELHNAHRVRATVDKITHEHQPPPLGVVSLPCEGVRVRVCAFVRPWHACVCV